VHPRDILGADLLGTYGDDAGRAARGHMLTRDAARHVRDPRPRHPLGVLERGGDGARRLVDVAHHPAADAAIFGETDTENLRERGARQIAGELRDHGAGLGAAEIEPGHEAAIRHQTVPPTELRRRTTTCPAKRASSSRYGRAFAARSLATRTTASITSGPASRLSNTRWAPPPSSSSTSPRVVSVRRAASIIWNNAGSMACTRANNPTPLEPHALVRTIGKSRPARSNGSCRPSASTGVSAPRAPIMSATGSTSRTITFSEPGGRRKTEASAIPSSPRKRSASGSVSSNTLAAGDNRSAASTWSASRYRMPTISTWD